MRKVEYGLGMSQKTTIKSLLIPRISHAPLSLSAAAARLRETRAHPIAEVNWPNPAFSDPRASMALGHGAEALYLHFEVEEEAVLARNTEPNSSVCQDSCVEFFFAPGSDRYVNVELNAIGTALVQVGPAREDRVFMSPDQIARIRRHSSLGAEPFLVRQESTVWHLTAAIPFDLLGLSEDVACSRSFRANFYKCGDHLPRRHYLSWNPIDTPAPDFHRPEYFGQVRFES